MKRAFLFAVPLLFSAAALQAQTAHADLINAKGDKVGSATLKETKSGVKIDLTASQLPPGPHALHIHAVGKCEAPAFTTAGGHFNPDAKKHGSKNPDGSHNGDLPNFDVGADGKAKVSITAAHVTLKDGPNSLFHPDGTALMIHEKSDDYMTDPTGNAGSRIACGVIQK